MANNNKRVSNPTVLVNNVPIAIIPNSMTFTEGLGEQNVEPQSAGGNQISTVYSEDVSTRLSTVKFSLANTEQNILQAREWKLNGNNNAIVITGTSFTRTFTNMASTSDYEIGLGSDTNIDLEFKGDPGI